MRVGCTGILERAAAARLTTVLVCKLARVAAPPRCEHRLRTHALRHVCRPCAAIQGERGVAAARTWSLVVKRRRRAHARLLRPACVLLTPRRMRRPSTRATGGLSWHSHAFVAATLRSDERADVSIQHRCFEPTISLGPAPSAPHTRRHAARYAASPSRAAGAPTPPASGHSAQAHIIRQHSDSIHRDNLACAAGRRLCPVHRLRSVLAVQAYAPPQIRPSGTGYGLQTDMQTATLMARK